MVDDREGGSKFMSGLPKKAPIGSEALYAAKELNSFYGNVGAAAGFEGPADAGGGFWDHILRAVIQMTGITSNASNPYAMSKALADERRAHR
jgi:hypothetical protein